MEGHLDWRGKWNGGANGMEGQMEWRGKWNGGANGMEGMDFDDTVWRGDEHLSCLKPSNLLPHPPSEPFPSRKPSNPPDP